MARDVLVNAGGDPARPTHLKWVHRVENLAVVGPSGTGKYADAGEDRSSQEAA